MKLLRDVFRRLRRDYPELRQGRGGEEVGGVTPGTAPGYSSDPQEDSNERADLRARVENPPGPDRE